MSSHQPNILLIFVDNHPASMLGCYGNDEIFSPHLDELASKGVLFRNAFCPNSMCCLHNPTQFVHRFRCNSSTDSDGNRPPIPMQFVH
jgi:hypothetical protein